MPYETNSSNNSSDLFETARFLCIPSDYFDGNQEPLQQQPPLNVLRSVKTSLLGEANRLSYLYLKKKLPCFK